MYYEKLRPLYMIFLFSRLGECLPTQDALILTEYFLCARHHSKHFNCINLVFIILWGRYYYYPYFKDEETEAPKLSNLPEGIHLRSGQDANPSRTPHSQTRPSDSGQSLASKKSPNYSNQLLSPLVQLWQEHRGQWHHQPSFAQESVWSCSQIHQGSLLGQWD